MTDPQAVQGAPSPATWKVQAMGLGFAAATLCSWLAILRGLPEIQLSDPSVGGRLGLAVQCGAVSILLTLCLGVQSIAMERALDPEAANPLQARESRILKVNARFLQNTLEQSVPFLLGLSGLAVAVSTPLALRAVPATAITWTALRWCFWAGYHVHPMYRAGGQFSLMQSHIVLCYVAYQLGAQQAGRPAGIVLVSLFIAGNAILGVLIRRSIMGRAEAAPQGVGSVSDASSGAPAAARRP